MFLIKCYCIQQNTRVTVLPISELLSQNQQASEITPPAPPTSSPPTQIRVKQAISIFRNNFLPKNGYFRFKTEKMSITSKFFIFKLAQVPNFRINSKSYLDQNLKYKIDKMNVAIELCISELVYNDLRNILILFDVLPIFSFCTNETMPKLIFC